MNKQIKKFKKINKWSKRKDGSISADSDKKFLLHSRDKAYLIRNQIFNGYEKKSFKEDRCSFWKYFRLHAYTYINTHPPISTNTHTYIYTHTHTHTLVCWCLCVH